jgi:NADH-quinone oxidoreductase subunit N
VALVIFLLSLAGFPPTGGFIGKFFLLSAAVQSRQFVLAVTLVLTSLVSYYYYLRVVWKMYFETAPEDAPLPATPGPAFRFAAAVAVVAILAAGLFPGHALRAVGRAGADLQPRAAQVAPGVPGLEAPVAVPGPATEEEEDAGDARS